MWLRRPRQLPVAAIQSIGWRQQRATSSLLPPQMSRQTLLHFAFSRDLLRQCAVVRPPWSIAASRADRPQRQVATRHWSVDKLAACVVSEASVCNCRVIGQVCTVCSSQHCLRLQYVITPLSSLYDSTNCSIWVSSVLPPVSCWWLQDSDLVNVLFYSFTYSS